MAEDALDDIAVVDEGHDAHLLLARGAEERIGFPDLFDEFMPLRRWDPARFVVGHVDDLHGLTRGLGIFGDTFVALAQTDWRQEAADFRRDQELRNERSNPLSTLAISVATACNCSLLVASRKPSR